MHPTKHMDHREYPRRCRRLSDAALAYIIHDASAAIHAYPANPNCTYYADEICYASAELHRRRTH